MILGLKERTCWLLLGAVVVVYLFFFHECECENVKKIQLEQFTNDLQVEKRNKNRFCSQLAIDEAQLNYTFGRPQMVPRVLG